MGVASLVTPIHMRIINLPISISKDPDKGAQLMKRLRFPLAVAATSLALVAVLIGAGGLLMGNVSASSPMAGGPWAGHLGDAPWASGHTAWQLPPQLSGLEDVSPDQRFSHFRGAQVQLTDKDNNPLAIEVVPGTATSVTQSSLTVTANDGSSRTFAIDDKTAIHGSAVGQSQPAATSGIKTGDHVVVVTLNNSTTAAALLLPDASDSWHHGPLGH